MKSLFITFALAATTLLFPAPSHARDWRGDRCDHDWDRHSEHHHHHHWSRWHRGVRYVDPHYPGVPPRYDRHGHLIDSRGHRVDARGHHLCF